jgi:hypothetical protein
MPKPPVHPQVAAAASAGGLGLTPPAPSNISKKDPSAPSAPSGVPLPHNQEARRVDRTWLLGSNFINNTPAPWKKIGTPWSTHMVLLSSLHPPALPPQPPSQPSPVRALTCNAPESILASGGRNGEVLVWDLRSHPPRVVQSFAGHRICAPNGYYRPESHELYDEGELKTGEVLQVGAKRAHMQCDRAHERPST